MQGNIKIKPFKGSNPSTRSMKIARTQFKDTILLKSFLAQPSLQIEISACIVYKNF